MKNVLSFTDSFGFIARNLMLAVWQHLKKISSCKTNADKFSLTVQYEIGKGTVSLPLATITKHGTCQRIVALV